MTRNRALRVLLLLLASLYPFAIALGGFLGIEPLDRSAVLRVVAASWSVVLLVHWLGRFVISDPDARASWLSIALLGSGAYGLLANSPGGRGKSILAAVAYLAAVSALATLLVKPWQKRRRDLVPLALVAASFVGVNIYPGVARALEYRGIGREASDAITSAPSRTTAPTAPARDIYYIVLDGLGRADTLLDLYGLEARDLVEFLRSNGFYVADGARSNYAHTLLSFSSFLNLAYLDPLSVAIGRENPSWVPLVRPIENNALLRLAKESGYEVTAIGSSYGPTKRFGQSDVCVCHQVGLDMFEQVVIGQTPLAALPLDRWTYDAHRRKILEAFTELSRASDGSSRRFVLAHILSPHPPFVFAADGSAQQPDRPFMFNEGSDFLGTRAEYVRGYRAQAAFILRRLQETIDTILRQSNPTPVIVVHSDHGPGSMLQQNDAARSNLEERLSIFSAYLFPGGPRDLYPTMTPVNGARELANGYLGARLPRLPDASWFSPAARPFDMTVVAPARTW